MNREQEYKQLAKDMFRRASTEENAQLTAQWKLLGARYLEISRQTRKTGDKETFYDPVQGELLNKD